METNTETEGGSLEVEPDSIDVEALRKARVATFAADLRLCGASKYIPVPEQLLEYDTREHEQISQVA